MATPGPGREPRHTAALVRALEELRDEVNSVVAAGESTDPDYVFLDANACFGGLPLSVQVAATKVGVYWGEYDGPITAQVGSLLEEVASAFQYGIRAQSDGCTAFDAGGNKCPSGVRGRRNKLFNLCRQHIVDFHFFASWLDEDWRPVCLECTNCSATEEDGDEGMMCFTCGRGIHNECLRRAFDLVEPGKLPANFGTQGSQFYVCPQCVSFDWGKVLVQAAVNLGQQEDAVFAVSPLAPVGDDDFAEDFGRFLRDKAQGSVPDHFLVALAPSGRRPAASGGGSGGAQPRRNFRGGSQSLSANSIPVPRPGRRAPVGGQANQAGRSGPDQQQEGSSSGRARSHTLRQQGGGDRDREAMYEYLVEKLQRDNRLPRTPPPGAGLERPITLRLVNGEQFGGKPGQWGSFDSPEAHAAESYHGQGEAMGPVHAKKVASVLGFHLSPVRLRLSILNPR